MVEVKATDADDPTYGNSARVIYSILEGQPYFSVEPKTGTVHAKLCLCLENSVCALKVYSPSTRIRADGSFLPMQLFRPKSISFSMESS